MEKKKDEQSVAMEQAFYDPMTILSLCLSPLTFPHAFPHEFSYVLPILSSPIFPFLTHKPM
jgi:hypothetical protein